MAAERATVRCQSVRRTQNPDGRRIAHTVVGLAMPVLLFMVAMVWARGRLRAGRLMMGPASGPWWALASDCRWRCGWRRGWCRGRGGRWGDQDDLKGRQIESGHHPGLMGQHS